MKPCSAIEEWGFCLYPSKMFTEKDALEWRCYEHTIDMGLVKISEFVDISEFSDLLKFTNRCNICKIKFNLYFEFMSLFNRRQ